MSICGGVSYRQGAADAIRAFFGGKLPGSVEKDVKSIAKSGGTPLVVARKKHVLGTVHLKDIVKGGLRARFAHFRAMGIRTVMITGDNALTASAIALEAGVDDFLAEAKPEDKLARCRKEQLLGHQRGTFAAAAKYQRALLTTCGREPMRIGSSRLGSQFATPTLR